MQGKGTPNAAYLKKLKRAAARLAGDVPAASQATAPAPDPEDAAAYEAYETYEAYEDEPEADRDPRPRGLYVVGGQPSYTPPPPEEPASPAAPEMPDFLKRIRQMATNATPLTQREADALRESTIRAFMRWWKYGDQLIGATNAERAEAHIWRDVDREETEILVDFMIERGKKSAVAAHMVRSVSELFNYYAVGLILAPRFYRTFRFYVNHGGIAL